MHLSISSAAGFLGVSVSTLRRWDEDGYLHPDFRTPGGHRRYSIQSLKKLCRSEDLAVEDKSACKKKTVLYSRVSSSDQKQDLARQTNRLLSFGRKNKMKNVLVIEDLGSGINYRKPGLRKLLKMLLNDQVNTLVLHHKDRLLRFGSELIFTICAYLKVEIIVLEEALGSSFEEELAADVIELMTVFSSRLYGRRAHLNKLKNSKHNSQAA